MFWANHEPTAQCTRQYMSAIFYHNEEQKQMAEDTMKQQQAKTSRIIQTKILPAETFYEAEDYHQKYILQKYPRILMMLDIDVDDLVTSHVAARLNGYLGGYGSIMKFEKEVEDLKLNVKNAEFVKNAMRKKQDINC